jgi:hypothetical protein
MGPARLLPREELDTRRCGGCLGHKIERTVSDHRPENSRRTPWNGRLKTRTDSASGGCALLKACSDGPAKLVVPKPC